MALKPRSIIWVIRTHIKNIFLSDSINKSAKKRSSRCYESIRCYFCRFENCYQQEIKHRYSRRAEPVQRKFFSCPSWNWKTEGLILCTCMAWTQEHIFTPDYAVQPAVYSTMNFKKANSSVGNLEELASLHTISNIQDDSIVLNSFITWKVWARLESPF